MTYSENNGYSLKKRSLLKWIYRRCYKQPYVARRLGMTTKAFKRKLGEREKCNDDQTGSLCGVM